MLCSLLIGLTEGRKKQSKSISDELTTPNTSIQFLCLYLHHLTGHKKKHMPTLTYNLFLKPTERVWLVCIWRHKFLAIFCLKAGYNVSAEHVLWIVEKPSIHVESIYLSHIRHSWPLFAEQFQRVMKTKFSLKGSDRLKTLNRIFVLSRLWNYSQTTSVFS